MKKNEEQKKNNKESKNEEKIDIDEITNIDYNDFLNEKKNIFKEKCSSCGSSIININIFVLFVQIAFFRNVKKFIFIQY